MEVIKYETQEELNEATGEAETIDEISIITSGTCGNNLTYTLTSDGVFNINVTISFSVTTQQFIRTLAKKETAILRRSQNTSPIHEQSGAVSVNDFFAENSTVYTAM